VPAAMTIPRRCANFQVMDKASILTTLQRHEAALRARGVRHVALFGSRARGDHRSDSDIDILIDIDVDVVGGVWQYAGLKRFIGELFDARVDVVNRAGLRPQLRGSTAADEIHAF
jgi:predicted nucleotidyltransferase